MLENILKNLGLKPKIIYRIYSKISGWIEVREIGNQRSLVVNETTQSISGSNIGIWSGMLPAREPKSALILGLGAGTLANRLHRLYPSAHITGCEIDPLIIKIARQYFGLDDAIKVTEMDARQILDLDHYDFIAVDLYLGRTSPKFIYEKRFLTSIKNSLIPSGEAVFNRVKLYDGKDQTAQFEKKLMQVFGSFEKRRKNFNFFYWVNP